MRLPKIIKRPFTEDGAEIVRFTSTTSEISAVSPVKATARQKKQTFLDKKNKYNPLLKRAETNLHNQIDYITNQLNHNPDIKIKERIELLNILMGFYTKLSEIKNNDEINRLKNELEKMQELDDYNSRNLSTADIVENGAAKVNQGYGIEDAAVIDFDEIEVVDVEIPDIYGS